MRRSLAHARSRSRSALPVIAEVDDDAPAVPEKAARRPPPGGGLRSHPLPFGPPLDDYPRAAPPSRGRIIESLPSPTVRRRSPLLVGRGGWYRLALIISVTTCVVVALAVGLSLGLRPDPSSRASPVPSDHQQSAPFPAGSFTFVTALSRASTACTSNPDAFRCYAYTTPTTTTNNNNNTSHADASAADPTTASPPASATFFWTIAPAGAGAYAISATAANPFGPQFANVATRLLDGDRPTERLAFEVPLVAAVVPTVALDGAANRAVTCYYNDTLLSATLWTRRPAEYPAPPLAAANLTGAAAATAAAAARAFPRWPYAVEVRQVARAGPAVPDCRDVAGRRVGDVSLPAGEGGECSCAYANFGL